MFSGGTGQKLRQSALAPLQLLNEKLVKFIL